MKISRIKDSESVSDAIISKDCESWYRISDLSLSTNLTGTVDICAFENSNPGILVHKLASKSTSVNPVDVNSVEYDLPFQPLSYRDFMLFEKHYINSAKGFVKKYMPHLLPVINIYEKIAGRPFPKLKPKNRWYRYPIYYLGNHLTFVPDGSSIEIPSYTQELDYELELGALICSPLKNATPEEAEKAIGGFVVFNDFSARDIQLDEIESGFGPMKSKNFANTISNVIVTADEILPIIDTLQVSVEINGKKIVESDTSGMHYSLPEAIAYASWEEQLYPGEFFGSGTVPGCSGIENGVFLQKGDSIRLQIAHIGALENKVN
jgi:2-keto-4-pentenoate hydratase/2-oxohepta-3-ene-1,7-dioic acid hydratase in catechol pathway